MNTVIQYLFWFCPILNLPVDNMGKDGEKNTGTTIISLYTVTSDEVENYLAIE